MTRAEKASQVRLDRARGCLLGLAIGDALGASVEFLDPKQIREQYGKHKNFEGEGWLRLQPGEITDETQTAKLLGESLLAKRRFDAEDFGKRLVSWLQDRPRDCGGAERESIPRIAVGIPALEAGVAPERDASAGPVVRGVVLGIRYYRNRKQLRESCFEQCSLTHQNETVMWASYLAASFVGWSLDRFTRKEMHRLALSEFRDAPEPVRRALEKPTDLEKPSPFVGDVLHAVFHDFFREGDFESTLVTVVNRGGDADATGALAGALAGAAYGRATIPDRWADGVQWGGEMESLGERLLQEAENDRRGS